MSDLLAATAVDVHYHAGHDVRRRRYTVSGAARRYAALGGWLVVKSHACSTAEAARLAREQGLPVSGSVVLNPGAGGLSPRVVQEAVADQGPDCPARLVVHLPTLGESHHPEPLTESGRLRPEVREVIHAVGDLPVVLATGHTSREDTLAVLDEAALVGLDRVLLTHPTHPMSGWDEAALGEVAELDWLFVELTALTRLRGHHDAARFASVAQAHPRVVYSSDLGQPEEPDVEEWLALSRDWFGADGLDATRRREIGLLNPSRLLAA